MRWLVETAVVLFVGWCLYVWVYSTYRPPKNAAEEKLARTPPQGYTEEDVKFLHDAAKGL